MDERANRRDKWDRVAISVLRIASWGVLAFTIIGAIAIALPAGGSVCTAVPRGLGCRTLGPEFRPEFHPLMLVGAFFGILVQAVFGIIGWAFLRTLASIAENARLTRIATRARTPDDLADS